MESIGASTWVTTLAIVASIALGWSMQVQAASAKACDPAHSHYPFCDTRLPILERTRDLVSRLSLDEKVSQLGNSAPPIARLGIPGYEWWSESLHGLSSYGKGLWFNGTIKKATIFPQVILSAASFDANLWYRIAQAVGTEARAMYNAGQTMGMTFWAPNINIFRDPRWGRGQETPGEDPLLTGKYAVAYVRGLQGYSFGGGKITGHLQASACCKHFTAYDLENWNGVTRYIFDARVSPQDLADTYQPPFKSCVQEGGASGIMCAYNRVNGVPNCADYNLLTRTAGQWAFRGYITSDCDAVSIIHDAQGYAKTPEDAVAFAIKAGMDVNCGSYLQQHAKSAVQQNKLQEQYIDQALHNLFTVRMRLGLFDGSSPFGSISAMQVCSREHQNLALEAARNSVVLLKNTNRLLPLPKAKFRSLGVIGPSANSGDSLLGNYAGPSCEYATPLKALRRYVRSLRYHPGCNTVECSSININEALKIAKEVDYVVLLMGMDLNQEAETRDRSNLLLPGKQQSLITAVAQAAKKPVVLVLLCGGPVDITFAKQEMKVGSILWGGYPGQAGGTALAEIIFGEHNPGGKLPVTWYPQDFVKVPMTDMRMRPEPSSGYPGRTYRFYRGQKVYEFGYGLSYSTYSYKFLSVGQQHLRMNQSSSPNMNMNSSLESGRHISVSELGVDFCEQSKFSTVIGVKNHGEMPGKHPVLLFSRPGKLNNMDPMKQLIAFQSIHLDAGEFAEIEFVVSPCEQLHKASADGLMVIEEGTYFLVVGEEEHPITITI